MCQIIPLISSGVPAFCFRLLVLCSFLSGGYSPCWSQQTAEKISWSDAQRKEKAWYAGKAARRIADNVLVYQNNNGGWLKNTNMTGILNEEEHAELQKKKLLKTGTTIDNGATYTQLRFLAKIYQATCVDTYKKGFLTGLDYLLSAQYKNGGWPQYYPVRKGYYEHITFNDNAMIGVMSLLKDVAGTEEHFGFVDADRRERSQLAIDKGLKLILAMQVKVDGKLTVWCAQHDKDNLEPARARAYELPTLSGGESAGIVKYLMELEQPDKMVKIAVKSAVKWFEETKITGKKVVRKKEESLPRGYDKVIVEDPEASPLWARFYEIETNRPIFVGRDGIVRYSLSEIEHERRVGYSYLSNYAGNLLEKDYPAWKDQNGMK